MLKKVTVDQLRLGMHIHEFCGSWMDHPFWSESFKIDTPQLLREVQSCGVREVWIDTAKGLDVEASAPTREEIAARVEDELMHIEAPPAPAPTIRRPVLLAEEVRRAAKICAQGKEQVISMFQEVRMGKAIDHAAAGALVDEISASVMRNPGALISLARLRSADDYTYMHSVAVCALMVALARVLELDEATTREVGMAGLLHDLGKALTPPGVLNKPGKLTDEEFVIMKRHPVDGHRLLVEGGAAGEIPRDVCLHHHEKIDGSGYPEGLSGEAISLFAKMGAVCDVYDAITSNRPYKAGWEPSESIRRMAEWKGHFDERIFHAFVRSIGIYPVGSLVRLSSGRLGVVIEQSPQSLLTPKVKVFFSTKSQTYLAPEVVDLSRQPTEKIVGREEAAKWGIRDVSRFWAQD
ncbi:HD-GYP domain-containing protein [Sulfuricystis multivorans]|uniref:HD-GYP domain-containing protein n=1 Tax=Sulfuricystis multivorans TaxID=2211108 RepID=UPI000F81C588|nr:HD-GYP domain-containing protein [Sulfuricystis multivorans]